MKNKSVSVASDGIIGTTTYYQFRHDDFIARNPNEAAPDYYLDYGMKYALRFRDETSEKLSICGQEWISEVMINLQILMEDRLLQPDGAEFERNAKALRDFGFTTHVEAYWNENGGTPLYVLNLSDLIIILFAPDFRDLIRAESLSQMVTTMKKLAKHWFFSDKKTIFAP